MKITTIEISGFISCFNTLRKPFKRECKSDVKQYCTIIETEKSIHPILTEINDISREDIKLLQTLIKRGDEHAKAQRLINVTAEIEAPLFFWNEMSTYTVGVTPGCSESTMHTLKKEKLTRDSLETDIPEEYLNYLNGELEEERLNNNLTIEYLKGILPSSYLQKRDINFSYQTLARIYKQRLNHKLPQWQVFTNWVKTLPLSRELIIGEE